MSDLVSMKVNAKEREEMAKATLATDVPRYPWGLSLSLDDESLDKLDLEDLPKVGSKLTLTARVEVTACSVSANSYDNGKKRKSVSLQIVAMSLEPESEKKGSIEDRLYAKAD